MREQAEGLAQKLGLPLHPDVPANLCLELSPQKLQLRSNDPHIAGTVSVDFCHGATAYRHKSSGRKQILARAAGLKPGFNPRILDATAGLGRDAFILAALGCEVILLERSPVVVALLQDGLRRALQSPHTAPIIERMRLINANAVEWLQQPPQDWPGADVICLDPMYPERRKSALVKKEMRLFQKLLGADTDSRQLLENALSQAHKRVVVKRPKGAEMLGGKPDFSLSGKTTRFDVYMIPNRSQQGMSAG